MTDQLDLEAIEARYAGLSDDWSGYADGMGDNAGRCELFSGPWVNGYRTGLVFAVREDCGCGCYPPCPQEMRFIETARQDVPALVAEVKRLRKLTCENIADEHVALVAEVVRLRAAVDALEVRVEYGHMVTATYWLPEHRGIKYATHARKVYWRADEPVLIDHWSDPSGARHPQWNAESAALSEKETQ